LSYQDAIEILKKAKYKGENFHFEVKYGIDLQREHEKYLSESYFKNPVFVTNWPKEIKPFYMKQNEDCETVSNMDLLVPQVGEIAGGSEREERYEHLVTAMKKGDLLNTGRYQWYLDLRKYGTVPHAGYGLGFERFIQYVTGIKNIQDTIPVPRVPGNCYM